MLEWWKPIAIILMLPAALLVVIGLMTPKRQRLLGDAWEPFAAQTSIVPFAAIAVGRNRFIPREIGLWRWAIALLAYGLMLGGHAPVVGVSPFPA